MADDASGGDGGGGDANVTSIESDTKSRPPRLRVSECLVRFLLFVFHCSNDRRHDELESGRPCALVCRVKLERRDEIV